MATLRYSLAVALAVLVAAFAVPANVAARPKVISGKLSASGYTVLAVAKSGEASSERVGSRRKFRLRPAARRVTLHLRAETGGYAGPVVVAKAEQGREAILGVRAGARLGMLEVKPATGYAKAGDEPPSKFIDSGRWARAKRGVPIGAGNFGLVRSKQTRGGAPGDRDLDGVANPLDIDDDGDRVLDNLELPAGTTSLAGTRRGEGPSLPPLSISPALAVPIESTANVNAAGLGEGQADATLAQFGRLLITSPVAAPELDCGGDANAEPPPSWLGGLGYCTPAGTGGVFGTSPEQEFPECCDADGDGLGTVVHVEDPDNDGIGTPVPAPAGPEGWFGLRHHATTAEIQTGDLLIERAEGESGTTDYPATLPFVFATNPALSSYADTAGTSAEVSYPVPAVFGPGTFANPLPVSPGTDGHVRLTLAFWRPQRERTPGDPGEEPWIDVGGLIYTLGTGPLTCPQSAYSTSDPGLATPAPGALDEIIPGYGALVDLAVDRPADAANGLSLTLDLGACASPPGQPFEPGDKLLLSLQAIAGGSGTAVQQFWIEHQ